MVIDDDFSDFTNALFTGVIELRIPRVVYVDPEFGDETVLFDKRMKPYGGVPLYQALQTLKTLDGDTRDEIRDRIKQVDDVLNDPSNDEYADTYATCTAACAAVAKELSKPAKVQAVRMANEMYPTQTPEIKKMFSSLESALSTFKVTYGL